MLEEGLVTLPQTLRHRYCNERQPGVKYVRLIDGDFTLSKGLACSLTCGRDLFV